MPNPMLNENTFGSLTPVGAGGASAGTATIDATMASAPTTFGAPPRTTAGTRVMTYGGTASAAGLMLGVLGIGAWFGWGKVIETTALDDLGRQVTTVTMSSPGWLFGAMIGGFAIAILTSFKPQLARFTSLPYAVLQGVVVGMISHLYDVQTKGIAIQAVIATMSVFLVMLAMYSLRVLRATPKFRKGVIGATLGILVLYLVGWVSSLFGASLSFWNSPSLLGIGISVVIVIVAALNLILDFDMIERGVNAKAPAYMDWYGAFGLIVTLVWLYLEMLRLLSKLNRR